MAQQSRDGCQKRPQFQAIARFEAGRSGAVFCASMKIALSKDYCRKFVHILWIERLAAGQPHLNCPLSVDMKTGEARRDGCGIIDAWKAEVPNVVSRVVNWALSPPAWAVQKIIPRRAIQGALSACNAVGRQLAVKNKIRQRASADRIRH
jgi:hypothetical protein